MLKKYLKNILISINQFFNTIAGGDPDETISSRVGKNYNGSFMHKFVNWLFHKQEDHCVESIEHDEGKDAIIAKEKSNKNLS